MKDGLSSEELNVETISGTNYIGSVVSGTSIIGSSLNLGTFPVQTVVGGSPNTGATLGSSLGLQIKCGVYKYDIGSKGWIVFPEPFNGIPLSIVMSHRYPYTGNCGAIETGSINTGSFFMLGADNNVGSLYYIAIGL